MEFFSTLAPFQVFNIHVSSNYHSQQHRSRTSPSPLKVTLQSSGLDVYHTGKGNWDLSQEKEKALRKP